MPCLRVIRAAGHRARLPGFGHLEVIHSGDVLNDAVACVVPDVDTEGEVRLGLHGQVRLDSSWPAAIYTPCCCVPREANLMKSARKRPTAAKLRSWRVSIIRKRGQYLGTVEALSEKAAEAAAVAEFDLSDEQRRRLVVQERD